MTAIGFRRLSLRKRPVRTPSATLLERALLARQGRRIPYGIRPPLQFDCCLAHPLHKQSRPTLTAPIHCSHFVALPSRPLRARPLLSLAAVSLPSISVHCRSHLFLPDHASPWLPLHFSSSHSNSVPNRYCHFDPISSGPEPSSPYRRCQFVRIRTKPNPCLLRTSPSSGE